MLLLTLNVWHWGYWNKFKMTVSMLGMTITTIRVKRKYPPTP